MCDRHVLDNRPVILEELIFLYTAGYVSRTITLYTSIFGGDREEAKRILHEAALPDITRKFGYVPKPRPRAS